jgi:hypothetical protein
MAIVRMGTGTRRNGCACTLPQSEDFDERRFCSVYRKVVLISFGRRPDCQALLLMLMLPARQELGPLGQHTASNTCLTSEAVAPALPTANVHIMTLRCAASQAEAAGLVSGDGLEHREISGGIRSPSVPGLWTLGRLSSMVHSTSCPKEV